MTAVTTLPPDKVVAGDGDLLNLFLYHVAPNGAFRNADLPKQVRPGERGQPPLPLTLDYLVTTYGKDDHLLLGKTMSVLHDTPLISPDVIKGVLEKADLHLQIERVRLTWQPLSLEDMYRLWNGFQTQYRISAAYQVSVVLIESTRAVNAALPVIRRGEKDDGVRSSAGATPFLTALVLPQSQPSVRLGDTFVIQGLNLTADNVRVRFVHEALPAPIELAPTPGEVAGELNVTIPDTAAAMSAWVPGLYTVSLVVARPDTPRWTTNELTLGLAPRITRSPSTVNTGDTLTVTCAPRVRKDQRVLVVVGRQQAPPLSITNDADLTKPTTFTFKTPALDAGAHLVRLRVDGVDSIPVIRKGDPPIPTFDPDQMV
jgi:hypothetical protein